MPRARSLAFTRLLALAPLAAGCQPEGRGDDFGDEYGFESTTSGHDESAGSSTTQGSEADSQGESAGTDGEVPDLPGPAAICGDGVREGGEACDDGNTLGGDECSADCAHYRRFVDLGVSAVTYDHVSDEAGTIHALWKAGSALRYGTLVDGALVGAEDIPDSGGANIRFKRPRIAVRPDGAAVHTCWHGLPGTDLQHAWRDADGWQRETIWTQPTPTQYLAVAAIAADLDGVVHVIAQRWEEGVQPSPVVYLRKPGPDLPWADPVVIQDPEGKQWRDTAMFTDALGGVHAAWKTGARPGRYRSVLSGQDLAAAPTLEIPTPPDPGIDTVSFGDLFVDAAGDVHHVFVTYPLEQLWYEVRRAGTSEFGEPSLVGPLDNDEGTGYENPWPAVAVDEHGRVYASWAENRGGATIPYVVLASFDGRVWTREDVSVEADVDVNSAPALTARGDTVYLVHRDGGGTLTLVELRDAPPG